MHEKTTIVMPRSVSYTLLVLILFLLGACGAGEMVESDTGDVSAIVDELGVTIQAAGQPILRYQVAHQDPPEGVDPVFGRSAFIHPLWSPSGDTLTRINPPDHWHHYGIWNPWTRTNIGGRAVDFWNLGDKQGTVRHKSLENVFSGPDAAGFTANHDHVAFGEGGSEDVLMTESWQIRVARPFNLEEKEATMWDLAVSLQSASADSVILEAYRYGGGLGFRATEDWTNQNSWVLTSEGESRETADGTEARWALVGGTSAAGRPSTLLFMGHPDNQAFPEPMRVWPLDANEGRGDMFFEFCPIRHEPWILQSGTSYHLRYRVVVIDGKIGSEAAESLWQQFVRD